MTAPITITVVDRPDTFGQFGAIVSRQGAWQLEDATNAATPPLGGEFEFPLTLKVQDAKGNILKMRVQREVAKPELSRKKVDPR
jgi:hypothetical protein